MGQLHPCAGIHTFCTTKATSIASIYKRSFFAPYALNPNVKIKERWAQKNRLLDALPLVKILLHMLPIRKVHSNPRIFWPVQRWKFLFRYMMFYPILLISAIKDSYNLLEAGCIRWSPQDFGYIEESSALKGIRTILNCIWILHLLFKEHQESYVARRLYEHRVTVEFDTKNNLDPNIGAQPNPAAVALHGGAIWWEHIRSIKTQSSTDPEGGCTVCKIKGWCLMATGARMDNKKPRMVLFAGNFFFSNQSQPKSLPALASTPLFSQTTHQAQKIPQYKPSWSKSHSLHICQRLYHPKICYFTSKRWAKKVLENIIWHSSNTLLTLHKPLMISSGRRS